MTGILSLQTPIIMNSIVVGSLSYILDSRLVQNEGTMTFFGGLGGLGIFRAKFGNALLQGTLSYFHKNFKVLIEKYAPKFFLGTAVESTLVGPMGSGIVTAGLYALDQSTGYGISNSDIRDFNEIGREFGKSVVTNAMGTELTKGIYPLIFGTQPNL